MNIQRRSGQSLSRCWQSAKPAFLPLAAGGMMIATPPAFASTPAMATAALTCAQCTTTQDFLNAAENGAIPAPIGSLPGQYVNVLVTVFSALNAETAYVQMFGSYSPRGYFSYLTAVPVDASGTPLPSGGGIGQHQGYSGGSTETANEVTLAALDATLFGLNRKIPTTVAEPANYGVSIINSIDEELSPGISLALAKNGILLTEIPIGTIITVTFQDGTSAQFVFDGIGAGTQWRWTGKAWNAAHQPIDRGGTLKSAPYTSGGNPLTGPVSIPPIAISGWPQWPFAWIPQDLCKTTYNYVSGGVTTFLGAVWGPCG